MEARLAQSPSGEPLRGRARAARRGRRDRGPARDPRRRARAARPSTARSCPSRCCASWAPHLAADPRPARAAGPARSRDAPRPARRARGARRPRGRRGAGATARLREAEAALEALRRDRREQERRREMLEFQAARSRRPRFGPARRRTLRAEKLRQANAGRLARSRPRPTRCSTTTRTPRWPRLRQVVQAGRGAGGARSRVRALPRGRGPR